MSGTSSDDPVVGIHDRFGTWLATKDWSMPITSPAAKVGTRFLNPPTTAAASAGTMNNV